MKKIFLYNSLTRKKEEFKSIKDGSVGLYTCGPTVYNYAHIGNFRSYIFADLLVRVLRYNYSEENLKWVMNITDVDDKTIKGAKEKYPELPEMKALRKITAEFEEYFWQDLEKLNIKKPNIITNATNIKYLDEMKKLVASIYSKGYAYVKNGSIYFDVTKYSQKYKYGLLVDIDISALKTCDRIDTDEYEKESVQDFVLWKGKKEGEPFWDFNLNGQNLAGRPGWHIECSAMGELELGCPFDIHTGGIDLKFPHHENEIHQSVVGYGVNEPVKYWMHNEHLLVDGKRMGKRFNNFYTVKDLEEKGVNPLAYRFLCMQTHYRKQMNFTWKALMAAQEGLQHIFNQVRGLGIITGAVVHPFKEKFLEAINDDLNTPKATAVVQEMLKSDEYLKEDKLATFIDFDKVLGFNISTVAEGLLPAKINKLKAERQKAKDGKDYSNADRIRVEIEKLGYTIEDTKEDQRIYKKQ
jgi:cysteinyl-tRNA synthetase